MTFDLSRYQREIVIKNVRLSPGNNVMSLSRVAHPKSHAKIVNSAPGPPAFRVGNILVEKISE